MMDNVIAVHENDEIEFSKACEEIIEQGYVISSTSCGFLDMTGAYDFCACYQAILIKKKK